MTTIKTIRHWLNGVEQAALGGNPRPEFAPPPPPPGVTPELTERYFPGVKQPEPIPATKQLRTNLERVTLAYNDRERVLVKEITEREAELADVRRARDASTLALMELDVDLPEIAVPDGEPWPAQMADAPHQDLDALAVKYGGARYVPHDAVRAATDQTQDAVEAVRHGQ